MSSRSLDNRVAKWLEITTIAILVFLPFHAFLTVWTSSAIGHYTLLRLWKEFLLACLVCGTLYLVFRDRSLRSSLIRNPLIRLVAAYLIFLGASALVSLWLNDTSSRAVWYGLLVDSRFLIFFLVTSIVASKTDWLRKKWKIWLMAPAIVVAAFAISQYLILPYNFLSHFGYSSATIEPYETINSNINHIRVFSTLRGANPLGAYLVLPITVLILSLVTLKRQKRNEFMFGMGLLLALIFSFSRSAWIGALLSIGVTVWASIKSSLVRTRMVLVFIWLVIIAVIVGFIMRDNRGFENIFFHTEEGSTNISSNEGHFSAFQSAITDIAHQPMGSGVGTAGPQSTYDTVNGARISENYYLQIGQELGIFGIILFVAIIVMVSRLLWSQRSDLLCVSLFASLVGLSITNMFLHAWADDTLAYVWWGLAGIALSPVILGGKNKQDVKN